MFTDLPLEQLRTYRPEELLSPHMLLSRFTERATDLLNADAQLAATQNISQKVDDMNADMRQGFNVMYAELDRGFSQLSEQVFEGNLLMEDVGREVAKTRNAVNAGTLIGALQRRKTNKQLTSMSEDFRQLSAKFDTPALYSGQRNSNVVKVRARRR